MATIVEYSDRKPPKNESPTRIVSPSRSGPCCFFEMEEIGEAGREEDWTYRYKRCRTCGFTVRIIVHRMPDERFTAKLQQAFQGSGADGRG